jgi:hypothetical protein
MGLSFDASAVAFGRDTDLNAEYLVLAEHQDGSGRRLEIQRAVDVDERDEALGQNTYCIVTAAGAAHYGGILHWEVADSTLRISLDRTAAQVLGTDGFRIAVPHADCAMVDTAVCRLVT